MSLEREQKNFDFLCEINRKKKSLVSYNGYEEQPPSWIDPDLIMNPHNYDFGIQPTINALRDL